MLSTSGCFQGYGSNPKLCQAACSGPFSSRSVLGKHVTKHEWYVQQYATMMDCLGCRAIKHCFVEAPKNGFPKIGASEESSDA